MFDLLLRQVLCDSILLNISRGEIASIHPAVGGIYCDSCPPAEFAETAANQSARFLNAAQQPESPQAEAVAGYEIFEMSMLLH